MDGLNSIVSRQIRDILDFVELECLDCLLAKAFMLLNNAQDRVDVCYAIKKM